MNIRYGDIVKAVRHSRRILLIVGAATGAAVCTAAFVLSDEGSSVRWLAIFISAAVVIGLLINCLAVDKRLEKMWANVGSPDTHETDRMLERAVCLEDANIMMLLTDEMVLNFETIRAYRLTDINKLRKTANTDEGTVTSYNVAVSCSGYPFGEDTLSFRRAEERDAAFDMILQACRRAGGTEKIAEK